MGVCAVTYLVIASVWHVIIVLQNPIGFGSRRPPSLHSIWMRWIYDILWLAVHIISHMSLKIRTFISCALQYPEGWVRTGLDHFERPKTDSSVRLFVTKTDSTQYPPIHARWQYIEGTFSHVTYWREGGHWQPNPEFIQPDTVWLLNWFCTFESNSSKIIREKCNDAWIHIKRHVQSQGL